MMRVKSTKFFFGQLHHRKGLKLSKFLSSLSFIDKKVWLQPRHFLVGLTKNKGPSIQNFMSTKPNCYLIVPTLKKGWKCLRKISECTSHCDIKENENIRLQKNNKNHISISFTDCTLGQNPYRSQLYEEVYKRSIEKPEEFWAEVGRCIDWSKPWDKVLDNSNEPFTKW